MQGPRKDLRRLLYEFKRVIDNMPEEKVPPADRPADPDAPPAMPQPMAPPSSDEDEEEDQERRPPTPPREVDPNLTGLRDFAFAVAGTTSMDLRSIMVPVDQWPPAPNDGKSWDWTKYFKPATFAAIKQLQAFVHSEGSLHARRLGIHTLLVHPQHMIHSAYFVAAVIQRQRIANTAVWAKDKTYQLVAHWFTSSKKYFRTLK